MKQGVCYLSVVLAALAGGNSPAAAPPAGPRDLTLSEALRRSLEHAGFRVTQAGGAARVYRPMADGLEAERGAVQALLNAEVGYWNLHGARQGLSARERALRLARETLRACESRRDAGLATDAEARLARARYELASRQAAAASADVAESERQLRSLMGLAAGGRPLAPSDAPSQTAFVPDWGESLKEALARRVELRQARNQVRQAQIDLGAARQARNQVRQAQIDLAAALEVLHDQEEKAQRYLGLQYRRLVNAYEQIRANRAQREAFGEQLRARQQEFLAGRGTLDTLLEAQRFWADALANEFQQIVAYNNALAGFEFARGASLKRHKMAMDETAAGRR